MTARTGMLLVLAATGCRNHCDYDDPVGAPRVPVSPTAARGAAPVDGYLIPPAAMPYQGQPMPMAEAPRAYKVSALMAADGAAPSEQAFSDFHLYTLPGQVTLRDRESQTLVLLETKTVAVKPLYVYRDAEKLLFASEPNALLAYPGFVAGFDPAALEDYLAFGTVGGSRSVFRGVEKLLPAHTLLTGPDGLIAEGAITNIAFSDGSMLTWPDAPCLAGVTWQLVEPRLADAGLPTRRGPVRLADLPSYTAAIVTNSHGVAPAGRIGQVELPGSAALAKAVGEVYESVPWDLI